MTAEELIARAEDLVAAWNDRDIDRILSAFTAEVRFRDVTQPWSLTGRGAIRTDAEQLFDALPDLTLAIRRTVAAGRVVTQEWTARATRPSGSSRSRIELPGATVADYDTAGRIARYVRYWHTDDLDATET